MDEIVSAMLKMEPLKLILLGDAMYFHAAKRNYEHAMQNRKVLKKAESAMQRLEDRKERILTKCGGDAVKAYDELESICIQMHGSGYEIGRAYGPILQSLASVHILGAAALEAYVNARGKEKLKGKLCDQFEKLSLEAKWLILPKLLGLRGFDPGRKPFQAFSGLVRIRNALLHYKEHGEPWASRNVPSFLKDLGLTLEAGQKSLHAVEGMITELSRQLQEKIPFWMNVREISFFEII